MMRFSDFVTLQRGFDLPRSVMRDGPYPVLGSTSVIGYHNAYKVEPPGVVTGRSGSLGVVQYVTQRYWPHNTSLWVKDFKGNHPRYVYYCMSALDFARFNAGAGVPTLNRNHLDSLEVHAPPLATQRRIADILSAYDDLIENCQRRIEILEQMARGLYREWFVKFRYPGHESVPLVSSPLGEIPKGWRVSSIGDACSRLESGGTPRRNVADLWNDGDIDWYTTSELQDNYLFVSKERITEKAVHTSTARVFESGTILMAIYGSPTVGRLGVLTRRSSCNQAALGLIADSRVISQNYLYFLLQSLRGYFNSIAQGAAQQNISKEKVSKTMIVVPDAAARELFDASASALRDETRVLTETMLNLSRTRDLLLPRLISGQLEVDAA